MVMTWIKKLLYIIKRVAGFSYEKVVSEQISTDSEGTMNESTPIDVFKTQALPLTLIFEGEFSNDKDDKGGATMCGITQGVYNEYLQSKNIPPQPVNKITFPEIEEIYKNNYWNRAKCDILPPELAVLHFDSAVNHGASRANKFLQRAVGAKEDGIIGPKTIEAITVIYPEVFITNYVHARESFYKAIVERDATQKKFLRGWLRRLNFVKAYVLKEKTLEAIKKEW